MWLCSIDAESKSSIHKGNPNISSHYFPNNMKPLFQYKNPVPPQPTEEEHAELLQQTRSKIWGTKYSASPHNKSEQYVGGVTHETIPSRCVGGIPELNNITCDDRGQSWEELEVTVDSGAAVTVMPAEMCKYVPTEKTNDIGPFRAANGATIANHGMRSLKGLDENNMPMGFHTHVAGVNKFLASVNKLTEAGHRVEFDEETGHKIINKKTGSVRYMTKQSEVFKLPMWVPITPNPLSSVITSTDNVQSTYPKTDAARSGWKDVPGTFKPKTICADAVDYSCPFPWQALDF